jgi:hypothetical protein
MTDYVNHLATDRASEVTANDHLYSLGFSSLHPDA